MEKKIMNRRNFFRIALGATAGTVAARVLPQPEQTPTIELPQGVTKIDAPIILHGDLRVTGSTFNIAENSYGVLVNPTKEKSNLGIDSSGFYRDRYKQQ